MATVSGVALFTLITPPIPPLPVDTKRLPLGCSERRRQRRRLQPATSPSELRCRASPGGSSSGSVVVAYALPASDDGDKNGSAYHERGGGHGQRGNLVVWRPRASVGESRRTRCGGRRGRRRRRKGLEQRWFCTKNSRGVGGDGTGVSPFCF